MTIEARGTVPVGGTVACMARVVNQDNTAITQAAVTSITYSVYSINRASGARTAITGQQAVSLTVANVVYDTYQTDKGWSVDATGFNLRFVVDISAAAAFATVNTSYVVEATITPTSGQVIKVPFDVVAV